MKTIDIRELGGVNFNPILINALRQLWRSTKSFQCIGNPKKQNLLLYLNGCKITYTDKDGNVYVANNGDVVYTPVGSEYRAIISSFKPEASHTIGINFLLTDEEGCPIVLSEKIKIFRAKDAPAISALFNRAAIDDRGYTTISGRIILMEILEQLIYEPLTSEASIISKTIHYLSKHIEKNPSIADLAERCNVSEVYLRRKFKERMGISPAKYKNELRLGKAISYLKFGDISVQEISDMLGYATVSHFIKEFKRRFGTSPLQYRKNDDSARDAASEHP